MNNQCLMQPNSVLCACVCVNVYLQSLTTADFERQEFHTRSYLSNTEQTVILDVSQWNNYSLWPVWHFKVLLCLNGVKIVLKLLSFLLKLAIKGHYIPQCCVFAFCASLFVFPAFQTLFLSCCQPDCRHQILPTWSDHNLSPVWEMKATQPYFLSSVQLLSVMNNASLMLLFFILGKKPLELLSWSHRDHFAKVAREKHQPCLLIIDLTFRSCNFRYYLMFAWHTGKHSVTAGCHSVDLGPQRFQEIK